MKYNEELLELPENVLKSSLIPFVAIPIIFSTIVIKLSKFVLNQGEKKNT